MHVNWRSKFFTFSDDSKCCLVWCSTTKSAVFQTTTYLCRNNERDLMSSFVWNHPSTIELCGVGSSRELTLAYCSAGRIEQVHEQVHPTKRNRPKQGKVRGASLNNCRRALLDLAFIIRKRSEVDAKSALVLKNLWC